MATFGEVCAASRSNPLQPCSGFLVKTIKLPRFAPESQVVKKLSS